MEILTIPSPESYLAERSVILEERAQSRMGNAEARTYYPSPGRAGELRVTVSKSLTAERRRWSLWHEAAHTRDCITQRRSTGAWVGHPCVFGYGRLSIEVAQELRKHDAFLRSFSSETRLYVWASRSYTCDEAVADSAVPPHVKARIRRKEFDGRMRHMRYKSSALELFAEAIACAICEPVKFDAGAPGLRAALRQIAGPEGFPV